MTQIYFFLAFIKVKHQYEQIHINMLLDVEVGSYNDFRNTYNKDDSDFSILWTIRFLFKNQVYFIKKT